jgi:CheY-like chemotaxis protein
VEARAGGAAAADSDDGDAAPGLRGRRILLVEDEIDSRELIAMYLSRCGADVLAVSSARDAITSLEEGPPDLLISDIAMPGKSGYDLIREVRSLPREQGGKIPAVALTAYAAREDVDQALRAGFDLHIAKPVEMRELARRVADLITESRAG